MPRFIIGDELGNIKTLTFSQEGENSTDLSTIHQENGPTSSAIQKMAYAQNYGATGRGILATAHADGIVKTFALNGNEKVTSRHTWKEPRMKGEHSFVGLSVSDDKVYSCTSGGALRACKLPMDEDCSLDAQVTTLPSRLAAWHLSPGASSFAYGGDEVETSVWDTERAFSSSGPSPQSEETTTKKRKRNDQLFSGEVWRAKNVANDHLGLRQPVRITSLAWLSSSTASHQLLAGTQLGDLRRYDSRAARKPVSDWKVFNDSGIKAVQVGFAEHEVFVSDTGSRLFSIDLRNGRTSYGYKGIAGAVNCIAPSPSVLCSTALDRFARIHSTFAPPKEAGKQQSQKGAVLEKVYTRALPTAVLWDQNGDVTTSEEVTDDVWQDLERIDDAEDSDHTRKRSKK